MLLKSGSRLLDSFAEMERLHRQMNSLLETNARANAVDFPPVNVWTSENTAIVTSEIPGLSPEDIDISVINETLTIRGGRKPEQTREGESLHRQERGFGQFARSIQLPFRVNTEQVKATFKKGVLQIELPRAEADKPRRIAINLAQ